MPEAGVEDASRHPEPFWSAILSAQASGPKPFCVPALADFVNWGEGAAIRDGGEKQNGTPGADGG